MFSLGGLAAETSDIILKKLTLAQAELSIYNMCARFSFS